MSEPADKRITFKRARPNPLFQNWLHELHEEASAKKSKLEPMLKLALKSLSKYPLPLQTGAECAILTGFDKRLCKFLDKRLEIYASNSFHERPNVPENGEYTISENFSDRASNNSPESLELPKESNIIVNSKTKSYKPAHRSGGYAILLALLEISSLNNNQSVQKYELIATAQKYSEESFCRPKAETFYTAWSNMSRLISKGLVSKGKGKKAGFTLTERGKIIANELLKESKDKSSANDIIFRDDNSGSCSANLSGVNHDVLKENCRTINQDIEKLDTSDLTDKKSTTEDILVTEMKTGSFDIILLIDKNETGGLSKKNDPTVAQFQKYPDLSHEYRSLKVGDFTWIARHKINKDQELVLPYIVERKRMDDLGASIKDGRFHEQKFRLRKCGLKNVIYLVENYGSNKHVGLPVQSLMQALANTRIQDGFKVHITDSLTNSARFLAMLTKRLTLTYKDHILKGHNQEPIGDILMTFNFFNKSSLKNKPLTITDTFIKLLLQLKGVSVEKALAITSVYKTPNSLIKAYEGCDKKEGEFLLAHLKYNDSRNVGAKVSKSIYQLFTFVDI